MAKYAHILNIRESGNQIRPAWDEDLTHPPTTRKNWNIEPKLPRRWRGAVSAMNAFDRLLITEREERSS